MAASPNLRSVRRCWRISEGGLVCSALCSSLREVQRTQEQGECSQYHKA